MKKRQTSIFDYRETCSRRLVRLETTSYIDLTVEDDVELVKHEVEDELDVTKTADLVKDKPKSTEDASELKDREHIKTEDIKMEDFGQNDGKIDDRIDGKIDGKIDGNLFNSDSDNLKDPEDKGSQPLPKIKQEFSLKVEGSVPILCPVCNRDLGFLELNTRVQHVEMCLVTPKKEEVDTKKRTQKNPDPRERYKNKKTKYSDGPKVIKHPTSHGERTRTPIPQLKIMDFPVVENSTYKVLVDAFSFAPHESISQYFLTHFHADHYGGITKKWSYNRVFSSLEEYEDETKFRRIIYASEVTSRLLTLRFGIDPRFIKDLKFDTRYCVKFYDDSGSPVDVQDGGYESNDSVPGLYVTPITANHCPGAAIFLFESISRDLKVYRILHCGDFRVSNVILQHPLLTPFHAVGGSRALDKVYLDTTYMDPKYNFPKQELVCETVANMFHRLVYAHASETKPLSNWLGILKQSRITDFMSSGKTKKKKFLILVGTYLIGKENLAIAILKKLRNCPIYVLCINSRSDKLDIIRTYDNEYLSKYVTNEDRGDEKCQCVVHLVPMNIVGSKGEISNYFTHNKYYDTFEQCVGLRPTGWSFQEKKTEGVNNDEVLEDYGDWETTINMPRAHAINTIADIMLEQPPYAFIDVAPSKTNKAPYNIYSLPYSEHSSFRELSYFGIFFNIGKIIPTVNTHNEWSIKRMDDIIAQWEDIRTIKRDRQLDMKLGKGLLQKIESLDLNSF